MKSSPVAKRYALSLVEVGRETGALDQLENELRQVVEDVASNRELSETLRHPGVPVERKKRLVESVFGGRVSPHLQNFLFVLLDKKRAGLLQQILADFVIEANWVRGREVAHVETALPLSAEAQKRLADALSKATGRDVALEVEVSPGLIGGLRVRIGDRVLDGSIINMLEALRRALAGNGFHAFKGLR